LPGMAAALAGTASALRKHSLQAPGDDESHCKLPEGFHVVHLDTEVGPVKLALREEYKKDLMARKLTNAHFWEIHHPRELAGLADAKLPEKGTFLDVGANVGWYSVLFAKIGYQVVAVEPMLQNREAIKAMLCLNPDIQDRVRLMEVAIVAPENTTHRCIIHATKTNRGNGVLTCVGHGEEPPCDLRTDGEEGSHCEVVRSMTLDQVLEETGFGQVDVAKMDIEGFECKAILGGQTLFTEHHVKLLQMETKNEWVAECFAEEAKKHGYRVGRGVGQDDNRVMSIS